jgi:hypothetical protein
MRIFLDAFMWGLVLAAPLWWLAWRLHLAYWVRRLRALLRRRSVHLPAQLQPLVLLGKRQQEGGGRRA